MKDDTISRQAAIDAVTVGAMSAAMVFGRTEHGMTALKETIRAIKELPSAQPEIVRCKDCKYMTEHYDTDGNAPYWTCSEWDSGTDYDGFCHYAERKIR